MHPVDRDDLVVLLLRLLRGTVEVLHIKGGAEVPDVHTGHVLQRAGTAAV